MSIPAGIHQDSLEEAGWLSQRVLSVPGRADTQTPRSSLEGILSASVLPMKNPVLREQGVQEDWKGGEGR